MSDTDSNIIGLDFIHDEVKDNKFARAIWRYLSHHPNESQYNISQKLGIPKITVQRYINEQYKCLKKLLNNIGPPHPLKTQLVGLPKNDPILEAEKRISESDVSEV